MAASNSNSKTTKYYTLKAKADEQNTPHFALSEKKDGKWVTSGTFDTLTGYLHEAKIREVEYQGSKKHNFVIVLSDNEEFMNVEMTHNSTAYSIINSLCNLANDPIKRTGELEIKVYRKHDKEKNKYYGGAALKCQGEKLEWSFKPGEAPKKVAVTKPDRTPFLQQGKQVYDSSEMEKFYEDLFLSKVATPKSTVAPATPEPKVSETSYTEDDDSGLPF